MAVGNALTGRTSELSAQVASGVTVTPNTPVGLDSTGKVVKACAETGAQVVCLGFPETSGAGTKSEGSGIFTHVNINTSGRRQDASWNWTIGAPVYVSETAGSLTQTAPNDNGDIVQQVGYATAADEIVISIGQPNYVGD